MLDRRVLNKTQIEDYLGIFLNGEEGPYPVLTKLGGESGYVAAIEARHDAAAATFDSRTVDKAPRV